MDDYILSDLKTSNPNISDHKAILFTLLLAKPEPICKTIQYKCLTKVDTDSFTHDILNSGLPTNANIDLHDLVSSYNATLTDLLSTHTPLKTKNIMQHEGCKWYTSDLTGMKCELWRLERKSNKSKLKIDEVL